MKLATLIRRAGAGKLSGWISVFAILVLVFARSSTQTNLRPGLTMKGQNVSNILRSFFESGKYDKRVRPNYGGTPVDVGITMQIISISTVSEVQMDFTSDFYFRQTWRDERLSFTRTKDLDSMIVGAEVADKIWVPDTFFANEKSAYFHTATTDNTFLRIKAGGDILRSIRLTVTATCPMDLRYFPMDRQSCAIEIESFGYTTADISYKWADGEKSVRISPDVELPQFKVLGHQQKTIVVTLSTGNYSRLVCEIRFGRAMGYYLIQIYIPAGLIVVISWVSFWLHRNATPARVALGVTTVLTMTTLMSSTNSQLPKISYVKSIDVYLGTCFVMVFASLLEYATVGYLGKRIAMRKSRAQQQAQAAAKEKEEKESKEKKQDEDAKSQNQNEINKSKSAESTIPANQDVCSSPNQEVNPILKSIGSCQVCPTVTQYRDYPFGMGMVGGLRRRGVGDTCCSSVPGGCGCPSGGNPTPQPMSMEVRLKMISDGPARPESKTSAMPVTPGGGAASGANGAPPSVPSAPSSGGPPADATQLEATAFIKNPNKLFGVSPSDIDKYSRVIFPVCFVCFQLMYWIIYTHISDILPEEIEG
ncbi:gamma-aminobutyric acid receptor subunit beta-like isoform X2 [Varroa jacobsoni]|uniref:gamma-aminobutyric acid receptor subunit beta-like isoform X2 n=1 Tax=Varroa jacobsoni TaxID=62625 RepID=UPI000BF3D342|nr:gamma-aminobutyric acid receptor subunit beta-like isoform X2 [Varroa jacobsoni]